VSPLSGPWLPFYSHVKEAKEYKQLPNVLFLNYEDMLIDLSGTLKSLGDFLDCTPKPEELEKLLNHLNIKNFRKNKSVNMHQVAAVGIMNEGEAGFVRKGGEGTDGKQLDQQEFLDNPELLKSANDWIQQNSSL